MGHPLPCLSPQVDAGEPRSALTTPTQARHVLASVVASTVRVFALPLSNGATVFNPIASLAQPPLIPPVRRVTALLPLPFRQALRSEFLLPEDRIGSQLVAFPVPKPDQALLTVYVANCSPPGRYATESVGRGGKAIQ
jgi:hypothetical protein